MRGGSKLETQATYVMSLFLYDPEIEGSRSMSPAIVPCATRATEHIVVDSPLMLATRMPESPWRKSLAGRNVQAPCESCPTSVRWYDFRGVVRQPRDAAPPSAGGKSKRVLVRTSLRLDAEAVLSGPYPEVEADAPVLVPRVIP
jgi:hypothetical protein